MYISCSALETFPSPLVSAGWCIFSNSSVTAITYFVFVVLPVLRGNFSKVLHICHARTVSFHLVPSNYSCGAALKRSSAGTYCLGSRVPCSHKKTCQALQFHSVFSSAFSACPINFVGQFGGSFEEVCNFFKLF